MAEEHFVIIGNGPAGNQAAFTLREKAPESRITILSREVVPCYKPYLIPDFIGGIATENSLYENSFDYYKSMKIKLRTCQQAEDIDIRSKRILLGHREVISYTGLIIAVGGTPIIPVPLLKYKDHMLTLKTIRDAMCWIKKLSAVETVLMIGGDLTSFAVTKTLLCLNKKVYFVLDDNALWPLRPDDTLRDEIGHCLVNQGVYLLDRREILDITKPGGRDFIVKTDKEIIDVGLIGAFFGLTPDVRFLARSGLSLDRGILVDEYLNTGFEDIYATGDCAQVYHPELSDYWVSIGHNNAIILGRIAALNLVGEKVAVKKAKESIYDIQDIKVNSSWWLDYS